MKNREFLKNYHSDDKDEFISKAGIKTQTWRTHLWIPRGKGGEVRLIGRLGLIYVQYYV